MTDGFRTPALHAVTHPKRKLREDSNDATKASFYDPRDEPGGGLAGGTASFPAALAREHRAQEPPTGATDVRGRYIVVFSGGASLRHTPSARVLGVTALSEQHATRYGVSVTRVYKWAFGGYAAEMSEQDAVRIAEDPRVAWVEPAHRIFAPSDMSRRLTAAGRLTRQTLPTGVDRVEADRSRTAKIDKVDQRVNVDVAVVDTGIDVDHPDLNVAGGTSCVPDPTFEDGHGHGTLVGGVIGALDNRYGVVGVAPGARLWAFECSTRMPLDPLRPLSAESSGSPGPASTRILITTSRSPT